MNRITNLDNLTRVTRRREFDDGLMDFVFAGTIFVLNLLIWFFFSPTGLRWFFISIIQNREITIIGLITLIPILLLLIHVARRMVERFRRAVIWRDSGFVRSLRWQVSWPISLLAGSVSVAMIITAVWLMIRGLLIQETVLRVLVSSTGVATGIVYFGMGNELTLRRYKWVGIAGMMLSAIIILIPTSFSISWLLLGIVWVIVLSLSGSWALRQSLLALRDRDNE